MVAVPVLVVVTAAAPAFTAGVVTTALVVAARDRFQVASADPVTG